MKEFERYIQTKHKGKSNAILSAELQKKFNCSGRDIRNMVNEMRIRGVPICICNNGYYYAESVEDIESTIAQLGSRIRGIKAAQDGLRKKFE